MFEFSKLSLNVTFLLRPTFIEFLDRSPPQGRWSFDNWRGNGIP